MLSRIKRQWVTSVGNWMHRFNWNLNRRNKGRIIFCKAINLLRLSSKQKSAPLLIFISSLNPSSSCALFPWKAGCSGPLTLLYCYQRILHIDQQASSVSDFISNPSFGSHLSNIIVRVLLYCSCSDLSLANSRYLLQRRRHLIPELFLKEKTSLKFKSEPHFSFGFFCLI